MDRRVREVLFPVGVTDVCGEIDNAAVLTKQCDLQIGLNEDHLVTVHGKGYLVLDFGKEINGCVRILTQLSDGGSCLVRVRTGESLSEACAELAERNAGNHHSLRDFTAALPIYSDLEFSETGFRFVRIDFCENKTVTIKAVLAMYIHRDLHPTGGFVCNDERVNRIFEVASRTLFLNMQNYIWDGIKRDRLVWIGDMHPETSAIICLFGADPSVEESLTYTKEHTPLPTWMNNAPTYTAWWFVILHDYYLQNADRAYLEEQREYLRGALELMDGEIKEDGSFSSLSESSLFDWPSHCSEDEKVGVFALWTLAAKCAEYLFREVGLDPAPARNLLSKLSKKRDLTVKKFKQCEAFLVYAGIRSAEDAYDFLTERGAHGFSTFMSYYILSAIADGGHPDRALGLMKEYYGGMLDLGATSFWEDFNIDWIEGSAPIDRHPREGEHDIHGDFGDHCYVGFRHSLCHGWSCGPVTFLIRKLGGIEVLEAGCRRVRVRPQLAGLEWMKIDYPTPFGVIHIECGKDGCTVTAPEEVAIER